MLDKWTGALVGKMHVHQVTYQELADEMGVTRAYISMVLGGHRKPEGIQQRMETALDTVIAKKKEDEVI